MDEPIRIDPVTRRTVLKGIVGAAGLVSVPAIIAACSSTDASRSACAAGGGAPQWRRRGGSGPSRSAAIARTRASPRAWPRSTPHSRPPPASPSKMNTVDHSTFQDQIANYLGGTPDTAYTWFSGFRMKFFADQGLTRADRRRVGQGQGQLHATASASRSIGNDGKAVRDPGRLLPVGRLLPEERLRGQGLHDPDDVGRPEDPVHEDADGRPDPDRVRRQGRLAGHGHVRHPQPPVERLRLPCRPDGRQGEVDGPEGHRGLREVEEILPFHAKDYAGLDWTTPRTRSSRRSPGCICSAVRLRRIHGDQGSGRPGRPRLLRLPDARDAVRRRGRARRADRHLAARLQGAEPRGRARCRQRLPRVLVEGLHPGHLLPAPAGRRCRPPRTATPASTATSRRRRSRSSGRPSGSPSSSTATRARTSPPRTGCSASCRPSSPTRPRTWPRTRRRSRTSGTSCPRSHSRTILTPCQDRR